MQLIPFFLAGAAATIELYKTNSKKKTVKKLFSCPVETER